MSEFKGTKGVWEVEPTTALNENDEPLYYDIKVNGISFVSTFRSAALGISDKEQESNAKLIAAAPELLETLNEVLSYLHSFKKEDLAEAEFMLEFKISQAIKKATE